MTSNIYQSVPNNQSVVGNKENDKKSSNDAWANLGGTKM